MVEDYVEDIKLTYPARGVVKDPFVNRIVKSIGLEDVSRFWEIDGGYRLTFNYSDNPMSMPYILFAHDADGYRHQVIFKIKESIISKLENYASLGWTMFVSNSQWNVMHIIWQPYWTREQVMIDLDLKGA